MENVEERRVWGLFPRAKSVEKRRNVKFRKNFNTRGYIALTMRRKTERPAGGRQEFCVRRAVKYGYAGTAAVSGLDPEGYLTGREVRKRTVRSTASLELPQSAFSPALR